MTERFPLNARIAVLYGGKSSEREVSLNTGSALASALEEFGYTRVERIDFDREGIATLVRGSHEAAMIALHGGIGENGAVQGLLECLRIPYTGAGVLASALAMDKVRFKLLLKALDISTPQSTIWDRDLAVERLESRSVEPPQDLPFVVKPSKEGSSVGVSIVREEVEFSEALSSAVACTGDVLIEDYIDGMEVTVAVLDGEAIGTVQVIPGEAFYDYKAKYQSDETQYIIPAPLPQDVLEQLHEVSERIFHCVGCRGVARVDFMLDRRQQFYALEINTVPGMTATSLVPKVASHVGISFPEFASRMLQAADLDE